MNALSPLTPEHTVRGQYEGYHEVDGVDPDSTVETYVAVRLTADTWRWAGVPIVIRAGKTMPVTATEISITFKDPPHDVFGIEPERPAGHAAVPDLAGDRGQHDPAGQEARRRLGAAGRGARPSPSSPGRTSAPTTG